MVLNKADLWGPNERCAPLGGGGGAGWDAFPTSTSQGTGVEALEASIAGQL